MQRSRPNGGKSVAEASDPADWLNTVDRIPYRRS